MSQNETEAGQAWENIEAGHGLVAIDPRWASAQNLPATFEHPKDPTKVVYVLEAYHHIHCVVSPLRANLTFRKLSLKVVRHADDFLLH